MDQSLKGPESVMGSQETSYVFVRSLGRGAFGEAVLYRKETDNSLVVWKEVSLNLLSDKDRKDAQNEIDILAMLNHPNIVSYYNHFLDEDTLLIEMEYMPCGNLSDKILLQKEAFPEREVMWLFYQLNSAVSSLHEYGILHRDIKSLNIFMGRSGLLKLGDFGISRIISHVTSQMAETVIGTPYYMSPELMKGERYDYKSDMWAVGCVLYELLSLSKVFDCTNRLQLAYQIVEGKCEDIRLAARTKYSEELYKMCDAMLDKAPANRPTAEDILTNPIFEAYTSEFDSQVWELNSATRKVRSSLSKQEVQPVITSQSSEVYFWGGGKVTPQKLEIFSKGRSPLDISAGKCHLAVLTVEKKLYTWTNSQGFSTGMSGQLGHGDRAAYKAPKLVQAFEEIPIKQVSCGEDFTICITDEGAVYAFGSDYYGCLGVDGEEGEEATNPVPIPFFAEKPVEQVSCGDAHVVALTKAGEVYTWGCGEFGRLGLGSEDDYATPQKVQIRGGKHSIRSVCASADGTFLLKTNGRVLACGSNEHNKLGLNSSAKGLRKRKAEISYDIPCKYTFTAVKPLSKHNIVSVSAGNTHTACIDAFGHLITFGSNKYGQLGVGDNKVRSSICVVSGPLAGQCVTKASCGDGFTVIATADNHLYSFGLAENGRLGAEVSDSGFSGAGSQYFALPRPIFGSLHYVSAISCHFWNTVVIAEKVFSQKTIRSTSMKGNITFPSQLSMDSPQGSITEENSFQFRDPPSGNFNSSEENTASMATDGCIAPWLQAELDDEVIPYNVPKAQDTLNESVPPWLKDELADAEYIPMEIASESRDVKDHSSQQLNSKEEISNNHVGIPEEDPVKDNIAPHNQSRDDLDSGDSAPSADYQPANISRLSSQSVAATSSTNHSSTYQRQLNGGENNHPEVQGHNRRGLSEEEKDTLIARLEARLSQFEFVERTMTQQNEDLRAQNSMLQHQLRQLEQRNHMLQQIIEQQAVTNRSQTHNIAHLEDKIQVLTEIQEQIWQVVGIWQQECKVAMEISSSTEESIAETLNSSTISTDSFNSSYVTDASHETTSTSTQQDGTYFLYNHNKTTPFPKQPLRQHSSNEGTDAADLHMDQLSIRSGPVMAAVSFFNSMSQVLQRGRTRRSLEKAHKAMDNGVSLRTRDINENKIPSHGGRDNPNYVTTEHQSSAFIKSKSSGSNSKIDTSVAHLSNTSAYSRVSDEQRTHNRGKSDTIHFEKHTHGMASMADIRDRSASCGNKYTKRYRSRINKKLHKDGDSDLSNVDFLFRPRSIYSQFRQHDQLTKTRSNIIQDNISSSDEEPGFKRAQSVPEQMNRQYELWNFEAYEAGVTPPVKNSAKTLASKTLRHLRSQSKNSTKTQVKHRPNINSGKAYKPATFSTTLMGVTTGEEMV